MKKEEPKQIKCYCGHTITCDCSPLEESKQETLEEAAERHKWGLPVKNFIRGAKWQAERMYSEEEVKQIIDTTLIEYSDFELADIPHWFEQFKKKV